MTDHEHAFGTSYGFGDVVMCGRPRCTELRIVTKRGGLRTLTGQEQIAVLTVMIQDLALVQALTWIHGKERAIQRVREVRGR